MSATGSIMIRNLRKPTDYQKAVMTQDQYLKIAASNDANIANARRDLTNGVNVPLTQQQQATTMELEADIGKNQSDALTNLLSMGFRYDQASRITTQLTHQENVIFNTMFPSIKADFAGKFNITKTTPTAFIEYLRKYIEIFAESKGISGGENLNKFDTIIRNVRDLRALLPARADIDAMIARVATLPNRAELQNRLNNLQAALPNEAFFRAVQAEDAVKRQEILDSVLFLTANIPSRADFADAVKLLNDGSISNRQKLDDMEQFLGGLEPRMLKDLTDIVNAYGGGGGSSGSASALPVAPVAPVLSPGGNDIQKMVDLNSIRYSRVATAKKPKPSTAIFLIFMTPTGGEVVVESKAELEAFFRANPDVEPKVISATGSNTFRAIKDFITSDGIAYGGAKVLPKPPGGGARASSPPSSGSSSSSAPSSPGSGKGGVGIRIKKIGRGIAVEETPTYRQLGKYVIHHGQLLNDVLNVKYPSLGRIPQFLPTHISPDTKDFIMDLLDKGKVSSHHYDTLPLDDRKLFEKIMTGAGIFHKLGLKKSVSDDERADYERFKILKGEYMAGNNSVALMKELRRFIVKFMNEGKIRKSEGVDLLMDLSI